MEYNVIVLVLFLRDARDFKRIFLPHFHRSCIEMSDESGVRTEQSRHFWLQMFQVTSKYHRDSYKFMSLLIKLMFLTKTCHDVLYQAVTVMVSFKISKYCDQRQHHWKVKRLMISFKFCVLTNSLFFFYVDSLSLDSTKLYHKNE